ncbi:MAG: U32 family peptidase [Lachnospiraceae bacterium]|nr:U32 family peptidase [Lachnospiraceae bacterium]
MTKKVELLAPAGNFNTMLAVIKAGCDAVYLAGNKFGARAYADNFNDDEILEAIDIAHLFNVKVYMTVNTLLKDEEIASLKDFMAPIVKKGLDGVIVQDVGVIRVLNKEFPTLHIHASTQLSILGPYAVEILKKYNVDRVVPARECSLEEIKYIKSLGNIEIESFIHGAMCYSYSGMCLFSSILGGRSGNRGRCAQPCRLPYHTKKEKEVYPFSMKDMCTISILPELIEAGIDSFKIEGRMKKAEYAAGVVSVYRKYIDLYYKNGNFVIEENDMNLLRNLYIRNEISLGYYHKNNGKDMVTLSQGAYSSQDEGVITNLTNKYVNSKPYLLINAFIKFNVNEPVYLSYKYGDTEVSLTGNVVEEAKNAPLNKEKLIEQVSKLGDTYFKINEVLIEQKGNGFIPIKALNELRRNLVNLLQEKIING